MKLYSTTMKPSVYSVIWADDECLTLKEDKMVRKIFDEKNIEVLDWVTTSDNLKHAIERYKDKVDAVIVDGNFSKEPLDYVKNDDFSGLIHTITFIDLFNVRRDIPFFLYTSKKVKIQEIFLNGEIDYFLTTDRLIQKGEIVTLAEKIIKDVEHIQSEEYRVKKKNKELLAFAKQISPNIEESLLSFLLNEARDITFKRTELMFNDLRNIMEKVVTICRDYQIVPDEIQSLNDFKYYWAEKYTKIEWDNGLQQHPIKIDKRPLMHKAMTVSLWTFIDILQDGSHSTDSLRLFIREYVMDTKRPYLFRTCLYQTLDILRWLDDLINQINDERITTPLYEDNY